VLKVVIGHVVWVLVVAAGIVVLLRRPPVAVRLGHLEDGTGRPAASLTVVAGCAYRGWMRLLSRVLIPIAGVITFLGLAAPAQAFQLQYFDTYRYLSGCLATGDSGLSSGAWYGYQCRRTGPVSVELWVSFSP